jgi:hypothetical protein
MQFSLHSRKGVSAAVVVVVAIIIVAVAAVAGYFLLTQPTSVTTQTNGGGTTTYSPPSTSAMMSETTGATTSAMMSETMGSTTATSAATSVNPLYLPSNSTQIFSLFSAMKFQLSATSSSSNQPQTYTMGFQKIGSKVINSVPTTEYNFTYNGGAGSNTTISLFYASNGTIISALEGGTMINGTNAKLVSNAVLYVFDIFLGYNGYFQNPTYYSQLTPTGTSTQTFGQVTMDVTSYSASAVTFNGNQYGSVSVSIGKLPGTNYSMVVYFKASGTTTAGTGSATFQLISATPA